MKILLVHNFYGSTAPSGENKVFEAEKAMLESHGETIATYTRHSDEIRIISKNAPFLCSSALKIYGLLKGALSTIANPFSAWALKKKIREFKPDVVHFHNQFPLISPLAIRAAHKCGCKVVMTLHNYRLLCAAGIPMRDGHVCTECFLNKDKTSAVHTPHSACSAARFARGIFHLFSSPSLRYRCYRNSLLATLPLAINIFLYRHCWARWVNKFIVLSDFQRGVMISCGFPASKLIVKGNFISSPQTLQTPQTLKKNTVLFVGRLSDEKGIKTLIEAWRILCANDKQLTTNHSLLLAGDGDQRAEYESLAQGLPITFLGQKSHDEVVRLMAEAKATVLPSEWWETFGLTVVESMLVGTPAIVSNLGALPSVIASPEFSNQVRPKRRIQNSPTGCCGEIFEAGNPKALASAIAHMLTRPDYNQLCAAARQRAQDLYSEPANYRHLLSIYNSTFRSDLNVEFVNQDDQL